MKFLVKGIVTAEDATLAMRAGADGIVVSNHGGRQEETLRSTVECLPEIVEAVGNILARELRAIMRQAGTPDLANIDKSHLARPVF